MATTSRRDGSIEHNPNTVFNQPPRDRGITIPEPSCWESFCDWCSCGWCCDKQGSLTTEGQAGNGKQTTHTEKEAPTHDYSKMNGGQSANGNMNTATNKRNSGQASGQQSANGNATTAKNKSSSAQASAQQSPIDDANTAKDKSNSGQAFGQQSENDKKTTAKDKSNSGQASGQQSTNDNAATAKDMSSSKQASGQPNQKQEHSNGSPGIGEKNKKDKLLGTPGSSDQDLGKKTGGTEQAVHNSSLKGAVRQEDTKKNGKDFNPRKEINSNFEQLSQEKPEGPPLKNEKQKDFGNQPSFKDKDNTYIETSLPKIVSSARNPSSEQQKDVPKQEKNIENQINTRKRSPVIVNSSSLGQGGQILSQEQQKSVTKPEGIKKDDKNTVPSHIETKSSI